MAGPFEADPAAVYAFVGSFFHSLRESGVEHVVLSPGSRSTPLSITAHHTPGLRTWIDLDERAAAFFALGIARTSGRPAALVCTSGTAAANYLPAIVEAHHARIPMIVATTDRPPELRDWGAGQTIEQVGIYGEHVRFAVDVPIPEGGDGPRRYAGQLAARAVDEAMGRPRGPVHLNWPLREPLPPPVGELEGILEGCAAGVRVPRFSRPHALARTEDLEWLADLAQRHARGVICAGPMSADTALRSAVSNFADASGWPVLSDPASNLRAGADALRAPILDAGDIIARSTAFAEGHPPDVVLRLGDTPVSKAQRLWIEATGSPHVIWLDEGGQWGEPSKLATHVIRGGAASLLDGAATRLRGAPGSPRLRERAWCVAFEEANERARKVLDEQARSDERFSGLTVASTIARVAPPDTQIFASNSMSIRLLDLAFARREAPLRVHCNRGASGIDGISSTALGTAAAAGVGTICLLGDLTFLHDLSGLLLARRKEIPLTLVVLDDNGGGIFSMLPVAAQGDAVAFHELFHTPHDLDLERIAAGLELDYAKATNGASLEAAIARAAATPHVSIVHVPVSAKENEKRFRAALAHARDAVERGAPS